MQQNVKLVSSRLLENLRGDLDRLRVQNTPVACRIVHRATNAEAEGVKGHPRTSFDGQSIATLSAGHKDLHQEFDSHGVPVLAETPTLDVNGNPIVDSAGNPIAISMPVYRMVEFFGEHEATHKLLSLAKRAGRVLESVSHLTIFQELSGWRFSKPDELLWSLTFEMAWKNQHPLLSATRELWQPSENSIHFVPYDLQQLRVLADSFGPTFPAQWTEKLPDAWTSVIDDMASAALDTIELVQIEWETAMDSTDDNPDTKTAEKKNNDIQLKRRFAVALSFPGEHRHTVSRVAKELSEVFTMERVLYDKYHESELAIIDSDLHLANLYHDQADLIVVFICKDYNDKEWCGIEWRAIRDILKSNKRSNHDVMFLRVAPGDVGGLYSNTGYIDVSEIEPSAIAQKILKRWAATR